MIGGRPRILIVKLSAIGDVVHTLPALNALRDHFPQAHITWLVEAAAAGLVVGHPALDRVLVSKRKTWLAGLKTADRRTHWRALVDFLRQLRDTRYDLLIDFQGSAKGAVLVAAARARVKMGFGRGLAHQEFSYLALNRPVPAISMEVHALERYLHLLRPMGIVHPPVRYDLPIGPRAQATADRLLQAHATGPDAPRIAINPMAQWPTKLWPNAHFAELADRLVERRRADVFFTGGPEDRGVIDDILGRMRHPAANLAGQTSLLELAALFTRMACVITTDTGPMHIASAVKAPVVAIFGPTSPGRTGPYGPRRRIVRASLPCIPCFKRGCAIRNQCMTAITAAQVESAVDDLLDRPAPTIDGGEEA